MTCQIVVLCKKRRKRRTEWFYKCLRKILVYHCGQAILRKFLVHEVKFQSVVKKPPLFKKHVKKNSLGRKKIWITIETRWFFRKIILFGHVFPFIIPDLPTLIDSSSGLLKVHVWDCFLKQGFSTLHSFTNNLNAAKIYQRLYYYLHKGGLWGKTKIDYYKRTMAQNIGVVFRTAWKQDNDVEMKLTYWISRCSRQMQIT